MEGDHNYKESKAISNGAEFGRPYYECVFCKRGFTTAQALGGHMNIHRKDRGKAPRCAATMSTSVLKPVPDQEMINLDGYGYYSHPHELSSYNMYFPAASTSEARVAMDDGVVSRSHEELTLFGEELCLGLSRHVDGSEEREVDLELRLGHQP
ncbi:transcriptional regulator TAC1-like [Typha angustifolia]|uniref:transcriptional regulator TAC1-like n=1 Tax=Typha angustifolia TaxID=59011 RepID=UPI003C2E09FE